MNTFHHWEDDEVVSVIQSWKMLNKNGRRMNIGIKVPLDSNQYEIFIGKHNAYFGDQYTKDGLVGYKAVYKNFMQQVQHLRNEGWRIQPDSGTPPVY